MVNFLYTSYLDVLYLYIISLSGITKRFYGRLNSGLETLLDWCCFDCNSAAEIAMMIESVESGESDVEFEV